MLRSMTTVVVTATMRSATRLAARTAGRAAWPVTLCFPPAVGLVLGAAAPSDTASTALITAITAAAAVPVLLVRILIDRANGSGPAARRHGADGNRPFPSVSAQWCTPLPVICPGSAARAALRIVGFKCQTAVLEGPTSGSVGDQEHGVRVVVAMLKALPSSTQSRRLTRGPSFSLRPQRIKTSVGRHARCGHDL
jgi:hypothetical protein